MAKSIASNLPIHVLVLPGNKPQTQVAHEVREVFRHRLERDELAEGAIGKRVDWFPKIVTTAFPVFG